MSSLMDRVRQWFGWEGPDFDERKAADRHLTIQKRRVARQERVVAEYRRATRVANRAGEQVISEISRDDP